MRNSTRMLIVAVALSLVVNVLLVNRLMTSEQQTAASITNGGMQYAFSRIVNDPKTLLLQALGTARDTVDIAIYHFNDQEVANAVIQAKRRGVNIRVITDAAKAREDGPAAILQQFMDNKLEVKTNSKRKMHLKMAIIDQQVVVTGSYNFTKASANNNLEQLLVLTNEQLAVEWTTIFDELWNGKEFEQLIVE